MGIDSVSGILYSAPCYPSILTWTFLVAPEMCAYQDTSKNWTPMALLTASLAIYKPSETGIICCEDGDHHSWFIVTRANVHDMMMMIPPLLCRFRWCETYFIRGFKCFHTPSIPLSKSREEMMVNRTRDMDLIRNRCLGEIPVSVCQETSSPVR